MMVIDATDAITGRLSAFIAKKLINGEEVVLLNTEKAVISGNPKRTVNVYHKRRGMRNLGNPENASKWPRRPDYLFKRILQGMLPKQTSRGKNALKKFRAELGAPQKYENEKIEKFKYTKEKLNCKTISLKELCTNLGWKNAEYTTQ